MVTMSPETLQFASSVSTWVIVLVIIAVFIRSLLKIHLPLRRTADALAAATARIRGGVPDMPENVFPVGPERLRSLWREFLEQRKENTVFWRGQAVSTLDPADIFHEQALFGASSRQLAGTLAGIFTGIGIFGTFLGLVMGLARVDTTNMMTSVGGLLGGMWTAFITSLFGIAFSLIWLYVDRKSQDAVRDAVQGFFIRVRSRYPVEGADRLLHRLLRVEQEESTAIQESRDILKEQNGILQILGADLATAMQAAVTESLQSTMTPQLQQMADAVSSLAVNLGERQAAAMEEMVDRFQKGLSEQLHGQLEGLASALSRASDWQAQVHGHLGELIDRIEDASGRQVELIETASRASETFVGSLDKLFTAHDHLQATAASIGEIASSAQAAAEAIGRQSEMLAEHAAELKAENQAYREANEQIRAQLARQLDALEGKVEEIEEFWTHVGAELEEAGERLKSGANEFGILASEKLGEIFSRFDAEMARVVEHLSGTLSEIREVTDELPSGLADLRSTLTTQTEEIRTSGDTVAKALTHLEELRGLPKALERLEPLGGSIDAAVDRFGGASSALEALATRVARVPVSLHEILQQPRTTDGNGATAASQVEPEDLSA